MVRDDEAEEPVADAGTDSPPIGAQLRAGRERVGLSREQIAQSLHLDTAVVTALEAGDFDSLGAPIFVKGHLRSYARLVKLDPAAIVAAYETYEKGAAPALPSRVPGGVRMDERSGWGSRIAWLVLVLIVAGIGIWLYRAGRLGGLVHSAQHAPAPAAGKIAAPAPASATPAQPIARLPATRTAAASTPPTAVLNGAVGPNGTRGKKPAQTTPNPPAAQPAAHPGGDGRVAASAAATSNSQAPDDRASAIDQTQAKLKAAEAGGGLPVALRLTGDSWVEVDDANGKRLYYGLARNGQTLYLAGKPPLHVFLGNAPDVRVLTAGRVLNTILYTRSDNTARFTIHQNDGKPPFAGNPEGRGAAGPGA
jgi:cytoskeleton protein RodZ